MKLLNSIVIENLLGIENYDDKESYYDGYWNLVINNPLIFLPENKIVFWGFEVKLSQNEYDLLKSIISLNSSNYSEMGYTAEKILKKVNYHRNNLQKVKNEATARFIITSKSSMRKKIINSIVETIISTIKWNKFNPFAKGKIEDRYIKEDIDIFCVEFKKDKKFQKQIFKKKFNLTFIFPYLLNFIKYNDLQFSTFVIDDAINQLIISPKGQKHHSKHRYFQTNFYFNVQPDKKNNEESSNKKYNKNKGVRKKPFQYAPRKFKHNSNNFITDSN